MWSIIGILFAGAIISIYEIPPYLKKKNWKEVIVFFLLLSAGMTLSILLSLDVTIPTPLNWIIKIYSPITNFVDRIL